MPASERRSAKEKHAACRCDNFNEIRGINACAHCFLEKLHADVGKLYDLGPFTAEATG